MINNFYQITKGIKFMDSIIIEGFEGEFILNCITTTADKIIIPNLYYKNGSLIFEGKAWTNESFSNLKKSLSNELIEELELDKDKFFIMDSNELLNKKDLKEFSIINTLKTRTFGAFHLVEHNYKGEYEVSLIDDNFNVLLKYTHNPIAVEVIDYLQATIGYNEVDKL